MSYRACCRVCRCVNEGAIRPAYRRLAHQASSAACSLSFASPAGQSNPQASAAEGVASWLVGYLFAQSGPIYAGTNEIQRNIIAERILGMPRK